VAARFEHQDWRNNMEMLKRLLVDEDGQGLMEYTFVVLLVALVFWLGVRDTNIGTSLQTVWAQVEACVKAPFSCTA
jgi:Flp pilus assembly pilin Flp